MTEQIGDAQLLADHVAGDPSALAELVRRHQDRLWSVALRTLGDSEEAADALQDAWISVFRNASSFRGESAVTTWLHRIVVNACLDRARRRSVRPTVPLPDEPDLQPMDPSDRQDERLVQLEIERALAALPMDQRAAVVLVDVEGWSVEDAAAMLGVPVGTVKSRCHRARAKLATQLAHLRNPSASDDVRTPGMVEAAPDREEVP